MARTRDVPLHGEAPDPEAAVERYRRHASGYDASARRTMWIRRAAVDKLALRPGDRVLDVACGTGLSLPPLQAAVGPRGDVTGVELSPDMIAIARQRVSFAGWDNVRLLESSIETATIPGPFDAVLFHFTHDVLRSPPALARIFGATRPGARVAFAGMKYAPWWIAPVNVIVRAKARPYMTTLDGLARPWEMAEPYLDGFHWYPVMFGTGYVGWGRRNGDGATV